MRRQLSALEVRCVVGELQQFVGHTFEKAYHYGGFEVLLRFKGAKGERAIHISSGSFVAASDASPPENALPTSFAMLLRKHLAGARLASVRQEGFDRIVRLEFSGLEGQRELVVELFGQGNVILLQDGVIVQPLTVRSWSARTLKAREAYKPPPAPPDLPRMGVDDVARVLASSNQDVVRTLATGLGLGGLYAEECCARAGVAHDAKASELGPEKVEALHGALGELLAIAEVGAVEPLVVEGEDAPVEVMPLRLMAFATARAQAFGSFSEALESFYQRVPRGAAEEDDGSGASSVSDRTAGQQRKAIERLEREALETEQRAESLYLHYKYYDDIITMLDGRNVEDVPELVKGGKVVDGAKRLYSVPAPDGGTATLQLGLDLNQNAVRLYELAKRLKERLDGARRALVETGARKARIEKVSAPEPVERREQWFERFRWFVSSGGNLVLGGRDAKTNEYVVKKHLKEADVYAHAEVHGAPSVVLKASGLDGKPLEVGDGAMREACEFSLAFSKLWNAGLMNGSSYWVKPDQVSKTPEPGEYLPKGAFVIRGKRNYARDIRVRCAIGPYEYKGERLVMCGPQAAVAANCASYAVLEPGDEKKAALAKKLAKALGVRLDDAMRAMPPGDCRVVEAKGIELSS